MTVPRLPLAVGFGVLALALAALVALSVGTVQLSPAQVFEGVFGDGSGDTARAHAIIHSLRLPRALVAACVGAALAAVGVVMQAILRNPLAEPGVTGVSAGAALGAVAGITLGLAGSLRWGVPLAAFAGALVAALVLQLVATTQRQLGSAGLILVGVSMNALAGAGISALIANAENDALARGAQFWLAGDLSLRDWTHVVIVAIPATLGVALTIARRGALDALALGDDVAATSGIHVHRERLLLLLVASLVTGAAVAVSGIISFVGLVVPHAVRLVVGGAHARLLPLSVLAGAVFLLVADTIARAAFAPAVVQTGVVCALVGAPLFLGLLLKRARA